MRDFLVEAVAAHNGFQASITEAEALQRQAEHQRLLDQIMSERLEELAHLLHDRADRYILHHSDVPVIVVPTNGHASAVR